MSGVPRHSKDEESGHDHATGSNANVDIKRRKSKQELQAAMRARSLSNGSTLGAFYQQDVAAPTTGLKKRRSSRRPSKSAPKFAPPPRAGSDQNYNSLSNTGSDLGDVASLAIAGLGDDIDIEELIGVGGDPRVVKAKKKQSIQKKKSGGTHLPTIIDDSAHYHDNEDMAVDHPQRMRMTDIHGGGGLVRTAGPKRRSTKTKRGSTNTIDSLRVSDTSEINADEDFQSMLSAYNRDDSMFLSEASDRPGNHWPNNGNGNENAFTNMNRQSLVGSNIQLGQQRPPRPSTHTEQVPQQQDEIANFAAMLHDDYGAADAVADQNPHPLKEGRKPKKESGYKEKIFSPVKEASYEDDDFSADESASVVEDRQSMFAEALDPTNWLINDIKFGDDGVPYFEESAKWTLAGMVRHYLFNPISPEFTSLQQFCWAVIIGIFMGFYTAAWKKLIEEGVEFMWKDLPEALLDWGFFTDLDGHFPLYHYMWLCPAFWGGLLSYIFVILPIPIPGQNEWIANLHTRGIQESDTFLMLFVLSTLGMMSGLSLGPELPLVLTSGMIGSWLGLKCKQSVLQARVMNITAGSAAIGGFFGFPMAGALFVMEIPHRMGLQYFEALSPATIASIVAVLCNRLITGNDVTGYYSYPFLTTSLPSEIFTSAIVFGLFGALVGTLYAKGVLQLKDLVHGFFHAPHDSHGEEGDTNDNPQTEDSTPGPEETPLLAKTNAANMKHFKAAPAELPLHKKILAAAKTSFCCVIPYEPYRAAASGVVAGALCGVIGMFLPHTMFWGEAQLQTMIDKGRTPLPVFGQGDEPTAALTALGFCMIDHEDAAAVRAGFNMGCAFAITTAKIVVTGLSLGTGIIGGHFWGPLFSGCAASHLLSDITKWLDRNYGIAGALAAYPCVTILCTMGSTHVVTFRAHTAIMLILTLTISAFDPEGDDEGGGVAVAGDYSAVFPLLVISVFVALMISRQTVFYGAQRSRGDIMALPEVLCEPGKEGMPMVLDYEQDFYEEDYDEDYDEDSVPSSGDSAAELDHVPARPPNDQSLTQDDIEKEFNDKAGAMAANLAAPEFTTAPNNTASPRGKRPSSIGSPAGGMSPLPPRPPLNPSEQAPTYSGPDNVGLGELSSSRLDELLAKPLDVQRPMKPKHRRIQSAPDVNFGGKRFRSAPSSSERNVIAGDNVSSGVGQGGGGSGRHSRADSFGSQASVTRVATFGHLTTEQPSLMDQARLRAATSVIVESRHVRYPSMPNNVRVPRPQARSHSRQGSASSSRGAHSRQGSASSFRGSHSRQGSASGSRGVSHESRSSLPVTVALAVKNNGLPASEVERAYATAVNRVEPGTDSKRKGN